MPSQPVRDYAGGSYGDRKALREQQQAAPLPQADRPGRAGQAPASSPVASVPAGGVFAPTERPDEPLTAGAPFGPGDGPEPDPLDEDPDYMLRAALAASGSPVLAALLARAAR